MIGKKWQWGGCVFSMAILAGMLMGGPAAAQMKSILVKNAWLRPTPPGIHNTALYAEIHNLGDKADRLVAVSSERAKVVEIHQVTMKDGMMEMRPVSGGLAVPAKGMAQLKPGGYHLMVIGLHKPVKKGETVIFHFTMEKAGKVRVEAMASMSATMGMAPMKGSMPHGHGEKKPAEKKPGMEMKK